MLIELLLASLLTALLIVPLGSLFIISAKANEKTKSTVAEAAVVRRITASWSDDVRAVAFDGVNEPVGLTCADPDAPYSALDTVELITFNQPASLNSPFRTITWVAQGRNKDVSLLRRICIGGQFKSEQKLAEKIGIHGRALTGSGGIVPESKCEFDAVDGVGRTCVLSIRGEVNVDVVAKRRAPDARHRISIPLRPPVPKNLTYDSRYGSVLLRWEQDAAAPPIEDFEIQVYNADGSLKEVLPPVSAGGQSDGGFSSVVPNLQPEPATYSVRMRVRNAVGWSDFSNEIPIASTTIAPHAPTVTAVEVEDRQATVTWTTNTVPTGLPLTGYKIVANPVDGTTPVELNVSYASTPPSAGASTHATITALSNFDAYTFQVVDINSKGGSAASSDSDARVIIPWSRSILVAPNTVVAGMGGNLASGCGSRSRPCTQLSNGIAESISQNREYVLASANTFSRIELKSGMAKAIRGGFSPNGFDRLEPGLTSTITVGANANVDAKAAYSGISTASDRTGTVELRNFTVSGGAPSPSPQSTYAGIDIWNSSSDAGRKVSLMNVVIEGGSGKHATGLLVTNASVDVKSTSIDSGLPTGSDAVANAGPSASSAYGVRVLAGGRVNITSNSTVTSLVGGNGVHGTSGPDGPGDANSCKGENGSGTTGGAVNGCSGRAGGKGGAGKPRNNNGENGSVGSPGNAAGGAGGTNCGGYACNGGNGVKGTAGAGGDSGTASQSVQMSATSLGGATFGAVFAGPSGNSGAAGTAGLGGGGGGGGGGGSTAVWGSQDGGGGGAGGGGGNPGSGGGGGGAGGASIGVLVHGSGSMATIDASSSVRSTAGGSGGSGGAGGKGASGSSGGNGAAGAGCSICYKGGSGGAGAAGGGGGGGAAGAGGQGGPSLSAVSVGGGTISVPDSALTKGSGGTAGTAGTPGSGGPGGNAGSGGGTPTSASAGVSCRRWINDSCALV